MKTTLSIEPLIVRVREHVAANTAIIKRLAEIDKTLLEHDMALRDLYLYCVKQAHPSLTRVTKEGGIWSAGACSRFDVARFVPAPKAAASRRTPETVAAAGTGASTPQAAYRLHR